MRTGTPNRSHYNRTTGSRTAKLYSKRTAQKLNRVYQKEQSARIRKNPGDRYYDQEERYDDYYDSPRRKSHSRNDQKSSKSSGKTNTIAIASLIVVILAMVIVGLSLLRPSTSVDLASDPTTAGEGAMQPVTTFEESDPPVIYGVIPLVVYQGHAIAYKQGVYVEDDTDPAPTLEIDNEDVDLSTPGRYIVSYIARDKDGNVTREFTSVTVLEGANLVSDEEINALADQVLASIITYEMSDVMKCLKVYEYLHDIVYVDEVHSEDWKQNAYWMLTLREGDCFCYYSAARLLLTRLGYEVMEVQNNNNYTHFWCLVSLDGGETWWHFDPTEWSWGDDGILCLVSDTYLSDFARRHITTDGRLIHAWDKTKYPATPLEDFWTNEERISYYGSYLVLDYYSEEEWDPYGELEEDYGYDPEYEMEYEYSTVYPPDYDYGYDQDYDYLYDEEYPVTYGYEEEYVYEPDPDTVYEEPYYIPENYEYPAAEQPYNDSLEG